MTRKKLEKLVSRYGNIRKLDHRLFRGYLPNATTHKQVWYMIPFGEHGIQLGVTLSDAIENMEQRIEQRLNP